MCLFLQNRKGRRTNSAPSHQAIWAIFVHQRQLLDNKMINYGARELRCFDHLLQAFVLSAYFDVSLRLQT